MRALLRPSPSREREPASQRARAAGRCAWVESCAAYFLAADLRSRARSSFFLRSASSSALRIASPWAVGWFEVGWFQLDG